MTKPSSKTEALEREKAALLDAMKLPERTTPLGKPDSQPDIEADIVPDIPELPDVPGAVAEAEQRRLAAEEAKAALEQSEQDVLTAKAGAAAHAYAVAAKTAAEQVAPMRKRVAAQLRWLQSLHSEYGPSLKAFAQSCASGSLAERTALQRVYHEAAGVKHQLAVAYQASEKALRLLDSIGTTQAGRDVSAAMEASKAALAVDVECIRDNAQSLVERYAAIKGGGLRIAKFDFSDPSLKWRPARKEASSDPETQWNRG